MMHYGFCRKHADQTGEGGCPECAMEGQQREIIALRAELDLEQKVHSDAATDAFNAIAKLCGCPEWDYPGQIVRDVESVVAERETLHAEVERLRNDLCVYGHHSDFCKMLVIAKTDGWKIAKLHGCSCGFDEAKALRGEGE